MTIEPTADTTTTFAARSVQFDIYDGSGELRNPPEVIGDGVDETVPVTVSGDTAMFTDGVADAPDATSDPFDEYTVRYLDADGAVTDATEPRLIGIGYNVGDGIKQNSTTGNVTFSIPRESLNDGISDDWDAEFQLNDDTPQVNLDETVPNEGNENGAFEFTINVDDADLAPGTYSSSLDLYNRQQNLGGFADRVITIFEVDAIGIKQTLLGELAAENVTTADTDQTLTVDVRDVRPDTDADTRSTERLVIDYFPSSNVGLEAVAEEDIKIQQAESATNISTANVTTAPDDGVIIIELEDTLEDDVTAGDTVEVTVGNVTFDEGEPRVDLGLADGRVNPDDGFRDSNVYHTSRDEFIISDAEN